MEVNSLPEEMLNNVLKYTKFARVVRLRKINNRIDNVWKRNRNSDKVPVNKLQLFSGFKYRFPAEAAMSRKDVIDLGLQLEPVFKENSLLKLLELCLSKIEIRKNILFEWARFGKKEFLACYTNRHHFGNVTELQFTDILLKLPTDLLQTLFMEVFPKVDTLNLGVWNVNEGTSLTEALGVRSWKKLIVTNHASRPLITSTADFLELVVQCQVLELDGIIIDFFTLSHVIELIKKCMILDGKFTRKYELDHVLLGAIALENVETTIMFNLPGSFVNITERTYRVTFEVHADAPFVEFTIEM